MNRNTRLQHTALVLALAAVYPTLGYGAAGTAQFANGEVSVKRGAAAPTPLTKGMTLESGDSISTGARGVAQIRFTDGGFVGVQPNSQFDITRYANSGNASGDSFLVNLARGGMRAITGLIGKRDTANYKVTTSTATVGIRGSSFHLAYNPDGTLSVATEQDAIEVCTAAGCIGLTAGESAIVPSNAVLPARTNARTSMPLAPFRQDPEVAGNQSDDAGQSTIVATPGLPPVLPPVDPPIEPGVTPAVVTGLNFNWAAIGSTSGVSNAETGALVTLSGEPTSFTTTGNQTLAKADGATTTIDYTAGTPGTADYMVLGTWSQSTLPDGYGGTSQFGPLPFVAGVATSASTIASMNMSGTYSMLAATPIQAADGRTGTLNSATMAVDFSNGSSAGQLDMGMTLVGPGINVVSYSVSGTVVGAGSTFFADVASPAFGVFAAYVSSATGRVNGFFGGTSAQFAGISYALTDDYSGVAFGGAAVLERGELYTVVAPGSYAGLRSVPTLLNLSGYPSDVSHTHEFELNGSQLYLHEAGGHGGRKFDGSPTGATFDYRGSPANNDFIGWGKWASMTAEYNSSSSTLNDVHYVVGSPTPASYISPTTGSITATYSQTGGTAPTTSGGLTGSLVSATLIATFTAVPVVSAYVTTQFGAATASDHILNAAIASDATFSGAGEVDTSTRMRGMFAGPTAERAGLSYTIHDGALGYVSGAVGFQKN